MLKRNLITISLYLGVSLTGGALYFFCGYQCKDIHMYQLDGFDLVFDLIKGWGITVAALIVYAIVRNFIAIPKNIKLLYFGALPLLAFYPIFIQIPKNISNSAIERSVCGKISSNGMTATATGLSLKDYEYVADNYYEMPQLPATAMDISFTYYTDVFLGEYIIDLKLKCDIAERINIKGKKWWVIKVDKKNRTKDIGFEDHN